MRKGISLIEILIALGLSSLIFLLVSTLLITFLNTNTKNSKQEIFEQAKNNINVELSNQIRWAEKIEYTPGNVGSLNLNEGKVEYKVVSGRIEKNGDPISPAEVVIKKFAIEQMSSDPLLSSIKITIDMENVITPMAKDSMRIVVSQRKTKGEINL